MKSNLAPNIESALCYLPFVGWIAAIVFLIIESNKDVRFDAMQSLLLHLAAFVLSIIVVLIPLIWLVHLILQLVLAWNAYQKQRVVLPVLGEWATKILGKISTK